MGANVKRSDKPVKLGDGRYLTRAQFAAAVGISEKSAWRYESAGTFKPAIPNPEGGKGHRVLYAVEQIADFKRLQGTVKKAVVEDVYASYTAEEAKRGFDALRMGATAESLVVEHGLHPSAAVAMRDTFRRIRAEERSEIVLERRHLERIAELPIPGEPPKSAETIVDALELLSSESTCTSCRGAASICTSCATDRETALRKKHAAEVERLRARCEILERELARARAGAPSATTSRATRVRPTQARASEPPSDPPPVTPAAAGGSA